MIARRVRYDAEELSADPRSRRSRTVGKDQLAEVLDGIEDQAHAYSFIALPSASHLVNAMWMWGALLAYNLSAWLQMLAPLGGARRRIATVRRLLIARAARLTVTARRNRLRFAPAASDLIATTLARIRTARLLLAA
ncbi:transposase [Streptomyces sp. NPDC005077]|uniref:transposase n=1 Tax=Streptomyces sp. NPDC005077 TaxID=3154292 RepID=UPI0033AE749A